MNNMKTKIIVTTRFVGPIIDDSNKGEYEYVFNMPAKPIPEGSPLYQLGVKEFREFSDDSVSAYAVTVNEQWEKGPAYTDSKKEWIESLVKSFCNDCEALDDVYLLLHGRTDLPPAGYGPFNYSGWLDFGKLNIHIWSFAHEKDCNFGVQPLLQSSYVNTPTPQSLADKVKALFEIHRLTALICDGWESYYMSMDENVLKTKVYPYVEEFSHIKGIMKLDFDKFSTSEDEEKDDMINSLKDVRIFKA